MYFTQEELDQYVSKIEVDHGEYLKSVVPNIIESLRKNPNNYLAFGVYWYHVKKVIQEYSSGDDWFYGDFHDQLIMEMSDHGDDFRNVVAALVYADSTDYFSSSSHTYTWKGDPRGYVLEDDNFLFPEDIEKAVATESVKRSAGGLKPLESKLEKKHNVKIDIFQTKAGIEFTKLIVPKEERGKGIGSKVMKEVIAFADKNGLIIGLTPSKDFGGTVGRLKSFYKRFGFVDNKGRNKDYSFRASMIRNPKGEIAMEAAQANFNSALGKPISFLIGQIETFAKGTSQRKTDYAFPSESMYDVVNEYSVDGERGNYSISIKEFDKSAIENDLVDKPSRYFVTFDDLLSKVGVDSGKKFASIGRPDIWKPLGMSKGEASKLAEELSEKIESHSKLIQKEKDSLAKGNNLHINAKKRRVEIEGYFSRLYGVDISPKTEPKPEEEPAALPIKIEGKLNPGLKAYFAENGIPKAGTQFENKGRVITLKETTPRGDISDVTMSYMKDGEEKTFPLTDIPSKTVGKSETAYAIGEKMWFKGDEYEVVTEPYLDIGSMWQNAKRLSDGKEIVIPTKEQKSADVKKSQDEWQKQQEGFSAVRKSGENKKPWQMTKDEFLKLKPEILKKYAVSSGRKFAAVALPNGGREDAIIRTDSDDSEETRVAEIRKIAHKQIVSKAKKGGKEVPAEVLKDYPELKSTTS